MHDLELFARCSIFAIMISVSFVVGAPMHVAEGTASFVERVAAEDNMTKECSEDLQFFLVGSTTPVVLSSRAASHFASIVSQGSAQFSADGSMGKPLGYFVQCGKTYYWQGNALTSEDGGRILVWRHPVLDEMIRRLAIRHYQFSPDVLAPLDDSTSNRPAG